MITKIGHRHSVLLAGLGACCLFKAVLTQGLWSMQNLWKYNIASRINLKQRYGENTWALITGATSGTGFQYAHDLASEGFNIVLMGRD